MFVDLSDDIQLAPDVIRILAKNFFDTMDTDNNGLVDGLELLGVMAICSGMKKTEMVEFSLSLYDFGNVAELSYDELVLAIKSACHGLCKLHNPVIKDYREKLQMPSDQRIEEIAMVAFGDKGKTTSVEDTFSSSESKLGSRTQLLTGNFDLTLQRRNIKELCDELLLIPEVCAWVGFFLNYDEVRDIPLYVDGEYAEMNHLQRSLIRTAAESTVVEWKVNSTKNSHGPEGTQWKSQVAMLTPGEFANVDLPTTFPDAKMKVDWVYGYQTRKCVNTLHYNKNNDLVYPISKYVIVYSSQSHSQRVLSQHLDEVVSVAMHPDRLIVASGEEGESPTLLVWHSETMDVLYRHRGLHRHAIVHLVFSPNGQVLLSLDKDENKTIIATRWADGTILFKDSIQAQYSPIGIVLKKNTFVCTCDTKIWFWIKYREGYTRQAGVFPKNKPEEAVLSILPTANGENVITGMITGRLMLWLGINCIRLVKAHTSAVTVLCQAHDGFLSGGKDCRVRMWTYGLEPKFLFDVTRFGVEASILGLSMSTDATSILFGTKGADIFEISAIDGSDLRGGPVVKSHAYGMIYGMDVHPSKFEYATVGSDKTIRVIDIKTKTLLKMAQLDCEGRAVAYSPLGDIMAIGTDNASTSGSMFIIVNEETLNILHSARDTRFPVTFLQFSPEGESLAVGTADGAIYVYSIHDDYELIARCTRHVKAICGIDFSSEGEWLRSNSIDGELYYFNVDDGAYQSNIASMRDVAWATQNCYYTWHSRGVHSHPSSASAITCCATPLSGAFDRNRIVAGSNLGELTAYAYPAAKDVADHYRYPAHCHAVVQVKFTFDGQFLLSAGQSDRCILQWTVIKNDESITSVSEGDNKEDLEFISMELLQGIDLHSSFPPRPFEESLSVLNEVRRDFSLERFQWAKSIVPPTVRPKIITDLPDLPVHLEHVYGYETKMVRNNVTYNSKGEVVYTAGCYGLVWNSITNEQRVYKTHVNTITAFCSTPDGSIIATGEQGESARVFVWESQTCKTLAAISEEQAYCVVSLAFSPHENAKYLAIASNDQFHTVSIHDWRVSCCVCKFYTGTAKLLGLAFFQPPQSGLALVTVGMHTIHFWSDVEHSRHPTCTTVNYKEVGRPQAFVSVKVFQGKPIIGTADGNLYICEMGEVKQTVKAHIGAVFAMSVAGHSLVTGGQDGVLRLWDPHFECLKEFALSALSKQNHQHAVRALAIRNDNQAILAGTQGAEILELSVNEGTLIANGSHIRGHNAGGLYALANHPTQEIFATAGDDALLRIYDSRTRKVIKSMKLELGARALAFSPDGSELVIGFGTGKRIKGKLHAKEGAFIILTADHLKVVHEGRDSNQPITAAQYSPDGKVLALGSADNLIYTYTVPDLYAHRFTIRTHQAAILSLDFSTNGNVMLSVDAAQRVVYTMVSTGLHLTNQDEVRDERWVNNACPITYATQGLWLSQREHGSKTDVEPIMCAKAASGLVLACANNIGDVYFTRFPAPERMGFHLPGHHVGPVSGVSWLLGDTALITSGQDDSVVLQWRCGMATGNLGKNFRFDYRDDTSDVNKAYFQHEDHSLGNSHRLSLWHNYSVDVSATDEMGLLMAAATISAPTASASNKNNQPNYKDDRVLFNWRSMITNPSQPPPPPSMPVIGGQQVAVDKLQEVHIHGLQRSTRQPCLFYNPDGKVIYANGNIAVILDRNSNTQQLYRGHTNEICAMNISPDRAIICSADRQYDAELHLWDSFIGQPIAIFKGLFRYGIHCMSFSSSGKYLLVVAEDAYHTLVILHSPSSKWQDGQYYRSTSIGRPGVTFALYNEAWDEWPIVCGGEDGYLHCFREVQGTLEQSWRRLDVQQRIQSLLCAVQVEIQDDMALNLPLPVILCGSSVGFLYAVQSDGMVVHRLSAHEGALTAILTPCRPEAHVITLGADDHCLRLWSAQLKLLQTIELDKILIPTHGVAVGMALGYSIERSSMILALQQGDLLELSLHGHSTYLITESHSNGGELHGLAMHPTIAEEFITAGDDGMLRVWHTSLKYVLRRKAFPFAIRTVIYSPDASCIVIGVGRPGPAAHSHPKDGSVIVLSNNGPSLSILREERKAKMAVTDLAFTSNGKMLIMCAHDGRVILIDFQTLNTVFTLDLETRRPALCLDLSTDDSMLRVAYQPDKLLLFSVPTMEKVENPLAVKDLRWKDAHVPFAWNTQGKQQVYSSYSCIDHSFFYS